MTATPNPFYQRLAYICGMFGSAHDGERANAARIADDLVKRAGLTWPDIITPAPVVRADPLGWQVMVKEILAAGRHTRWEQGFCESLVGEWDGILPRSRKPFFREFIISG